MRQTNYERDRTVKLVDITLTHDVVCAVYKFQEDLHQVVANYVAIETSSYIVTAIVAALVRAQRWAARTAWARSLYRSSSSSSSASQDDIRAIRLLTHSTLCCIMRVGVTKWAKLKLAFMPQGWSVVEYYISYHPLDTDYILAPSEEARAMFNLPREVQL